MNKFLVIKFHDNDFSSALIAMGEYLLSNHQLDDIQKLVESKEKDTIFTTMFQSFVSVYNGLNSYKIHNSDNITECMQRYRTDSYLYIKSERITLEKYAPTEWDNSETLIVDYHRNITYLL